MIERLTSKMLKVAAHPEKALFYLGHLVDCLRVRRVWIDGMLYHSYDQGLYPDALNHGNAMENIRETAANFCHGRGLDVGAGSWPFPQAKPVREEPELNAYFMESIPDGSQDYVFSSHCLEHLDRWDEALRLWATKLRLGGVLFLYLPHEKMSLWKPSGPWSWTSHKWQPRTGILVPFLHGSGFQVVDFDEGPDSYWSFWIAARKISAAGNPSSDPVRL